MTKKTVTMCMTCRRRPAVVEHGKAAYCEWCAPERDVVVKAEEQGRRERLGRMRARRKQPGLHIWIPLQLVSKLPGGYIPPSLLEEQGGIWDPHTRAFLLPDTEKVQEAKAWLEKQGCVVEKLDNGGWKARRERKDS